VNSATHRPTTTGARFAALLFGLLLPALTAFAHDPGLSYLGLRQRVGQLDAHVTFARADLAKVGATGNPAGILEVEVDGQLVTARNVRVEADASDAVHFHLSFPVAAGSVARVHSPLIAQLPRGHLQFLTLQDADGTTVQHQMLDTKNDRFDVALTAADHRSVFRDYVRHGIMHILTGYDHLLFITALVLAAVTFGDLVKVVSAFTLAHSLTLTLSVLNIVRLPERVVEPMIAGSIVFVAVQNIFWPERRRGIGRLVIAFCFGLFHGLGFAGGLLDVMEGMSGVAVGLAIVAFSLGVELGHQMVVLPTFAALKLTRKFRTDTVSRESISLGALRYGSACISLAGLFYLIAALR
jgi:hydrogenase/urease accessory protein HupE